MIIIIIIIIIIVIIIVIIIMTNALNETSLSTILWRYKLKDIYNATDAEFGLFYQGFPKKT